VLAPFVDLDHALDDLREAAARPDAIFLVADDGPKYRWTDLAPLAPGIYNPAG
jgi:hypothetical protein